MIDLILSWVPVWVWIVVALVGLLVAWRLLGSRGLVAAAAGAGTLLAYIMGRRTGGEKRDRERLKARQERLDMRQEGDKARQDAEALSDEKAREEALRWSRDS